MAAFSISYNYPYLRHVGSGLGLAIVKHIAQAHGGKVAVESEPNRGVYFPSIFLFDAMNIFVYKK